MSCLACSSSICMLFMGRKTQSRRQLLQYPFCKRYDFCGAINKGVSAQHLPCLCCHTDHVTDSLTMAVMNTQEYRFTSTVLCGNNFKITETIWYYVSESNEPYPAFSDYKVVQKVIKRSKERYCNSKPSPGCCRS